MANPTTVATVELRKFYTNQVAHLEDRSKVTPHLCLGAVSIQFVHSAVVRKTLVVFVIKLPRFDSRRFLAYIHGHIDTDHSFIYLRHKACVLCKIPSTFLTHCRIA